MRSLKMVLIALMLTGLFATHAKARDHAVNGLLIGTAIGGMVGYVVGNEMDRGYVYHQPIVYPASPPPPRYYSDRPYYRGRNHYRPAQVCREIVVVRERHGRYRETVETVCRDRDDWRNDRHRRHNRGPYRHDGYNDRW